MKKQLLLNKPLLYSMSSKQKLKTSQILLIQKLKLTSYIYTYSFLNLGLSHLNKWRIHLQLKMHIHIRMLNRPFDLLLFFYLCRLKLYQQ